jgi:hypothetical protein
MNWGNRGRRAAVNQRSGIASAGELWGLEGDARAGPNFVCARCEMIASGKCAL